MITGIQPLNPIGLANGIQSSANVGQADSSPSFVNYLESAMQSVADMQTQANRSIELAGAGQGPDVHTIMIQSEQAKLALDLTLQIRNKAIEAYQEIMRMQV